jgi:hypothetical protein
MRVRTVNLVAEVLFIGVLVCLASLPVVTVLASAAAGATQLRELVGDDRTPTVRRYLALLRAALRDPFAVLAPVALLVIGGLDVLAVLGGLPGGRPFGVLLAIVLAGLVVAGLRAAAVWQPGSPWRPLLAGAAETTVRDWPGSVAIMAAILVITLVVSMAPAFVVIAPGLLLLAAVAVCRRRGPA